MFSENVQLDSRFIVTLKSPLGQRSHYPKLSMSDLLMSLRYLLNISPQLGNSSDS
jgi:hypothetical protein